MCFLYVGRGQPHALGPGKNCSQICLLRMCKRTIGVHAVIKLRRFVHIVEGIRKPVAPAHQAGIHPRQHTETQEGGTLLAGSRKFAKSGEKEVAAISSPSCSDSETYAVGLGVLLFDELFDPLGGCLRHCHHIPLLPRYPRCTL